MATTIGTEYDHIDITNGVSTIRHPFKDASVRENLVKVQDTQPQSSDNVVWIKETPESEVQVPTYAEFEEVAGDVSDLKSALQDMDGGTTGQVLRKRSNSDYAFEWASVAQPTDEQVADAVDDWLDAHPEATTTVQDGTIAIPKLANDVKETIQPLIELSTTDAAGNTALLTSLLAVQDVKLKPGVYPVESTIVIDGHVLDMNGSKFNVPDYQASAIFHLKGFEPCIKNGEIEGSFDKDTTPSTNHSQTAITILASTNVVIKNMEIHHICGRGIDLRLADIYGELDAITSAESYTNGVHTTAKRNIIAGYKYMRTVGGYGYNSAYVVDPVVYIFYDDNDTEIGRVTQVPSINVEIPKGTVKYQLKLETGKSGLAEGFVPLNCGFTNHTHSECIENCKIHDCKQWGIANLFGPSYLKNVNIYNYTSVGSSGIDIEDHQTPLIICEDCVFSGIAPMNAFYAYFVRCESSFSAYAGKLHSFINCKGAINFSENREFYKLPIIHVTGGELASGYGAAYNKNKIDFIDKCSLRVTSGPVYFAKASNLLNTFSPTGFIFRKQTLAKAECVVTGRAIGTFIGRYTTGNSWVILNTLPGSKLFIYFDMEAPKGQIASALNSSSSGDCYGLIGVNVMIYPNGYAIYDSYFRPSGIGAKIDTGYTAGKYVNCVFDAVNGHIIDIMQTNSTAITFVNCRFRNLSQNTLMSIGNNVLASTFTFTNCIFEDASIETLADVNQYILPSLGSHTIVINGTSYTA